MNKKWIIAGFLSCLVAAGLYFALNNRVAEIPLVKKEAPPQPLPSLPSAAASPIFRVPPPRLPPVPPGVTVPPEVAKDPTALAYFLSEMTPISFYGKVVDEKGTPIEGATAKIGVADKIFQDPTFYTKISNADGLFSITDIHGLSLGINVSKDGYYRLPQSSQNYGYAAGEPSSGPIPTSDHPAIFMLRKKGVGVQLIVKSVSSHLPRDGTPVDIDLEAGKVVSTNTGNLQIELWSNFNQEEPNTPYDWKYQISVPGGGLIARTDDLDFVAPNDGYQTSDANSFTAGQPHYNRRVEKQYFVQLADGKYARMDISVGGAVNILAYINPTSGDHNLEPASK